jgi:hypothetical protein
MTAIEWKAALGRRTLLGSMIALAGLGCAGAARAQPGIVDLQVVNRETGQVLPVWGQGGRQFVAGDQGERYSLRVANHTDGRVLVVLSVDGVNIIGGETAGYNGRGYILGPYETADIRGWRKSETEIAAFAFTALPHSYAALTGRPTNVGVIGMAVFKERPAPVVSPLTASPPPRADLGRAPSGKTGSGSARQAAPPVLARPPVAPPADVAPPPPLPIPPVEKPIQESSPAVQNRYADRAAPAPRDEKLGTAHGAREWSVSHVVPFVRATTYPQLVRQIEYDSYANLAALGVIPAPPLPARPPRAFPGALGYVPDPPARF